jgi:hypothetical protein
MDVAADFKLSTPFTCKCVIHLAIAVNAISNLHINPVHCHEIANNVSTGAGFATQKRI